MHDSAFNGVIECLWSEISSIDPDAGETPILEPQEDEVVAGLAPFAVRQMWILIQRKRDIAAALAEHLQDPSDTVEENCTAIFSEYLRAVDEIGALEFLLHLMFRRRFPDCAKYPYFAIRKDWQVVGTDHNPDADDEDDCAATQFSSHPEIVQGHDGACLPVMLKLPIVVITRE